MEDFQYEPLDLDQPAIRLVRILPGKADDDIECEIMSAFFNVPGAEMDYEALSYVWGSSDTPEGITLDGKSFKVTSNLYAALFHLRYEDEPRDMWIDAISINQKNKKEQGHQVQQMADVYRNAHRVVIWLGTSSRWQTEGLMSVLKLVELKSRSHVCRNWKTADPRWFVLWTEAVNELQRPMAVLRKGLNILLNRSWWTRVWILQEVANARAAIILCGKDSVSTRIFPLAVSYLDVRPNSHCQAVLDIFPGTSQDRSWWVQRRDLRTLLLKFGHSASSEPRDKVYALLGLSSDACKSSHLAVDYEISLEELIRRTLSYLFGFHEAKVELQRLPDGFTLTDFPKNLIALSTALLLKAVEGSRLQEVGLLLGQDIVDTTFVNDDGRTPLYVAALGGHNAMVDLFLRQTTINTNPLDNSGRTLLSRLAERGDITTISQIASRPDIDLFAHDLDGRRALWYAIESDHAEVAIFLFKQIQDDADQILPTPSQRQTTSTILHVIQKRNLELIKKLIEGIRVDWKDSDWRSLLSHASGLGFVDVVKFLLQYPAVDVNEKCVEGRTALLFAAEHGHNAVVESLLRRDDIEINASSNNGMTPLCCAAEYGHLDIVKSLLRQNSINVNQKTTWGAAPLRNAVYNGHSGVTKLLLERDDIDINVQDGAGFAPLHYAILLKRGKAAKGDAKGRKDGQRAFKASLNYDLTTQLLGKDGIDVNIRSARGKTPISLAATLGSLMLVKLLGERDDVDVNLADNEGSTPLSHVARRDSLDTAQSLLEIGVDAGAKDVYGRAALWYATLTGQVKMVSLLLGQKDVDMLARDMNGHSPFDIAEGSSNRTARKKSKTPRIHSVDCPKYAQILETFNYH
jgi:ankyrin repeat protein